MLPQGACDCATAAHRLRSVQQRQEGICQGQDGRDRRTAKIAFMRQPYQDARPNAPDHNAREADDQDTLMGMAQERRNEEAQGADEHRYGQGKAQAGDDVVPRHPPESAGHGQHGQTDRQK